MLPSRVIPLLAAALLAPAAAGAADPPPGPPAIVLAPASGGPKVAFQLSGEERARLDLPSDKTFDGDLAPTWSVGNRARAGLRVTVDDRVGVFFQVQDVRTWGSEVDPNTGGDGTLADWVADGLDVHQAYGSITLPVGLDVRIGRQEVDWHGQRLIGSVGWTHQGRSFDGVRVRLDRPRVGGEVFYAKLLERPVAGDTLTDPVEDAHLLALRGGPRAGASLALDGVLIARWDALKDESLATAGAWAGGKVGAFLYEAEGYAQVGERGEQSVAAFLVGVRAGVALPGAPLTVWGGLDAVSGDSDPADDVVRAFDTLYATNHKFYGYMDAYLNLPVHTGGEGLVDAMARIQARPVDAWTVGLDVHAFASPSPADPDRAFHGVEIDLETSVKPWAPLTVSGGIWTYVPGPFRGDDASVELGGYVQTAFAVP
ncbi:alginate export family protein [Myxococcota bacterium]|nr:alginate export family protein [Myxococcota bacterium]